VLVLSQEQASSGEDRPTLLVDLVTPEPGVRLNQRPHLLREDYTCGCRCASLAVWLYPLLAADGCPPPLRLPQRAWLGWFFHQTRRTGQRSSGGKTKPITLAAGGGGVVVASVCNKRWVEPNNQRSALVVAHAFLPLKVLTLVEAYPRFWSDKVNQQGRTVLVSVTQGRPVLPY